MVLSLCLCGQVEPLTVQSRGSSQGRSTSTAQRELLTFETTQPHRQGSSQSQRSRTAAQHPEESSGGRAAAACNRPGMQPARPASSGQCGGPATTSSTVVPSAVAGWTTSKSAGSGSDGKTVTITVTAAVITAPITNKDCHYHCHGSADVGPREDPSCRSQASCANLSSKPAATTGFTPKVDPLDTPGGAYDEAQELAGDRDQDVDVEAKGLTDSDDYDSLDDYASAYDSNAGPTCPISSSSAAPSAAASSTAASAADGQVPRTASGCPASRSHSTWSVKVLSHLHLMPDQQGRMRLPSILMFTHRRPPRETRTKAWWTKIRGLQLEVGNGTAADGDGCGGGIGGDVTGGESVAAPAVGSGGAGSPRALGDGGGCRVDGGGEQDMVGSKSPASGVEGAGYSSDNGAKGDCDEQEDTPGAPLLQGSADGDSGFGEDPGPPPPQVPPVVPPAPSRTASRCSSADSGGGRAGLVGAAPMASIAPAGTVQPASHPGLAGSHLSPPRIASPPTPCATPELLRTETEDLRCNSAVGDTLPPRPVLPPAPASYGGDNPHSCSNTGSGPPPRDAPRPGTLPSLTTGSAGAVAGPSRPVPVSPRNGFGVGTATATVAAGLCAGKASSLRGGELLAAELGPAGGPVAEESEWANGYSCLPGRVESGFFPGRYDC